jgi:D-threo-aldose 1-dehydrogenase
MSGLVAERRRLGRTEVEVTALGFGAAPIGNLYRAVDEDAARAAVAAAFTAGVRYFDTAPYYGFGLSELRLGAALSKLGPQHHAVVSTKVGRVLRSITNVDGTQERFGFRSPQPYEPVFDYTYDGVMRSYESSLARLGRERIDILFVHDLGRATHGPDDHKRFREFMEGGYSALKRLRDSGAVGAIGLGVNEWQICERALAHADFDVFLLAGRYTLLEQTALDSFLPECARRKVSIVAGGPFNSGILALGTRSAEPLHYNYAPAPPEVISQVARIEEVCARHGVPLAAAALQFPLMHPQVAAVIPGLADAAQVQQAQELLAVNIPNAFWSDLHTAGLLHPAAPTPSTTPMLSPLILLHESDNVLVCRSTIRKGMPLNIDGETVSAAVDVAVGHKVARRAMPVGTKVIKYGAPIGSMTAAVALGGHVHLHNMRSDYIASHTREGRAS